MMEGGEYQYHHHSEEVVEMMGIMGGSNNNSGGSSSSSSSSSSRWNPTKEQISMLENLYKQGLRTPTAEEIQQITARLRVYGHIEGKNVFYWFQNHKARQRQKQKQHTIAYFNRFLNHTTRPHHHHHHPLFTTPPPICPNVMCAPYCMPQQAQSTEIGFYHHQHPKVFVPVGINPNNEKVVIPMGMMPTTTTTNMCTTNNAPVVSVPVPVPVPLAYEGGMMQMQQQQQQEIMSTDCNNLISSSYSNQRTLDLFPLHPTGILEGKATDNKVVVVVSSSSSLASSVSAPSASPVHHHINHEHQYGYGNQKQPFFDFFTSGQGTLESSG